MLSPIKYVVPQGQFDDGVELAVDAARYLWRGGRLLLGGGGRALLALQLATHSLLLHNLDSDTGGTVSKLCWEIIVVGPFVSLNPSVCRVWDDVKISTAYHLDHNEGLFSLTGLSHGWLDP